MTEEPKKQVTELIGVVDTFVRQAAKSMRAFALMLRKDVPPEMVADQMELTARQLESMWAKVAK